MARSCTRCGASSAGTSDEESVPLGWSTASSPRGVEIMCEGCTREHVREIEAKLDETWWT
ncbi:MAG: hypothetical protein ACT452_10970 [Microthrixaceae bacterium]